MLPRWFVAQTNFDPWVAMTADTCERTIAGWTQAKQRECDAYLMALYADNNTCTEFCRLYSDGRAETADTQMNALVGCVAQPLFV